MLEMGARFASDLYMKVTFNPDDETGVVTVIYDSGELETIKEGDFVITR